MKNSIVLFMLSLCFYSCMIEEPPPQSNNQDTAEIVDVPKAIHVAQMFLEKKELTKSVPTDKEIKEVIPVTDEKGQPNLYIVNYTDNKGFILISSSQDYNPILAFSNSGNFNMDEIDKTGASIWLENQKAIIKYATELPDSIKRQYRKLWSEYNILQQKITPTRSNEDVYNLVSNYIHQWEAEGYNVFRYSDVNNTTFFNDLPSNLIISIRQAVDSAHPDYGGRANNTFILARRNENYKSVGPLLQTHWSQQNGYNQYTPHNYA